MLAIQPSIALLGFLSQRNENLCHKHLYIIVYSSFIQTDQKLKTTKMFLSRGMVKQTEEYPYHGTALSSKKKLTIEAQNWYVFQKQ